MNDTSNPPDEANPALLLLRSRGLNDPDEALSNAITDLLAIADLLAGAHNEDLSRDEVQDANWRTVLRCLIEDKDIEQARELLEAANAEVVEAWSALTAALRKEPKI